MGADVSQMRKGLLEYCVMALLHERRRYGYELVQELSAMDGLLTSEGTIYPLLSRLRRDGLVETEWQESAGGPPRKYYALTSQGKNALAAFTREWSAFSASVNRVLSKAAPGGKS